MMSVRDAYGLPTRLNVSDSTPTLTPVPDTFLLTRALAALTCTSPSETWLPCAEVQLVVGRSTSFTYSTPGTRESFSRSLTAMLAVSVRVGLSVQKMSAPAALTVAT